MKYDDGGGGEVTELKRCPFCGKEQSETNFFSCDGYPQACGCWEMTTTGEEAEQVWNTRPIEDELNARIAQLTAQLAEWKADAERLIQLSNFKNKRANEYFDLHQQLVEKYGGEV